MQKIPRRQIESVRLIITYAGYFLLNLIYFTPLTYGQSQDLNSLLKCLGKEELEIHQKKNGNVTFKLNQQMIAIIVQLPEDVVITQQDFKEICVDEKLSSSFKLLESILDHTVGNKSSPFFFVEKKMSPIKLKIIQKSMKEFNDQFAFMFVEFLTHLQSQLPHYQCLEKTIPDLGNLFEEIRYLEEHYKILPILVGHPTKNYFKRIREKIKNLEDWKKECSQIKD